MSQTNQQNTFGIVLVAAAVGAAVGLLFAPKRGVETRGDIKNKYNDVKNKTQDKAHSLKDKINQHVETARSKAHDAADKSHAMIDEAADKTKKTTADLAHSTNITDEIHAEHAKRNRGAA